MSKIIDKIIKIPENVKIFEDKDFLFVEGKNGSLKVYIPTQIILVIEKDQIIIKLSPSSTKKGSAMLGTINSLITNALDGVRVYHKKELEVKGPGNGVILVEKKLEFSLGFSHKVFIDIPLELVIKCIRNDISVEGVDKQKVGLFAAKLRKLRKPNIFVKTLKGVFFKGEKIKIKLGKKDSKK